MTTQTATIAAQIVRMARDIAVENGARVWLHEPEVTENEWGGYDLRPHGSDRTYRVFEDDGSVFFYVFSGGPDMLICSEARVSVSLAHMVAREIGEALR